MTEKTAMPGKAGEASRLWTKYQCLLITVLVLVSICNTMDRGVLTLVQEHVKRELELSDLQLGLLSGPVFAVFYSLAGLPVARLSERWNRSRLLACCLAFWSAATVLCSTASSFLQIALFRAGVGLGEGGANPISHSLVADTFTARQRGIAMSVLSAAIPLGMVIAPLTIGFVAHEWGWRVAFLVAGLPGLILAPIVWFMVREPRHARTEPVVAGRFHTDLAWMFRNRAFSWVFAAAVFNGIGIMGVGLFTASFLLREYQLNIAQVGTIISIAGAMGLLGTFIGGYLADRFADDRGRSYVLVPAVGAGLSFLAFGLAFRMDTIILGIAFILVGNVMTDLKNGPNWAAVQNIVPSTMRTTASAIFFIAATVLGGGLGGLLVGAFSDVAAANHFTLGDIDQFCVAGHGIAGASAAVDTACREAVAAGLKTTLAVVPVTFLLAMGCFLLASRTIAINHD
ncbi:MAG: MFS transporter [Alphaproteobacteria bacterium]|nr:MFS transporter [Alphaproteobacteria bacterium]MBU0794720.1 MFS transporter [Alphaproteobacteria bacterium]MBU0875851.1 MFS transporter [Alphaproteobacteria bacterium]MBU1769969.1 MFS transporter [Alphaproteobacteria bacterium]